MRITNEQILGIAELKAAKLITKAAEATYICARNNELIFGIRAQERVVAFDTATNRITRVNGRMVAREDSGSYYYVTNERN